MKKFMNFLIFVTISVTFATTIYVPEHTSSNFQLNARDYVQEKQVNTENKLLGRGVQQLNNNDNVDDHNNADGQQSLLNTQQAQLYVRQLSLPIRRQEKSYDIDDDVVVSAKNRTNNILQYENLEAQPTGLAEQQQTDVQYNDVLLKHTEEHNDDSDNNPTHVRQKRQLTDFLIAPNTRWCGRGNTANGTYNHLGGASMADKCCRTHDHCKFYIPAMSNRFDLFNYRPYTLSHCNCDRRFRTCLKMANDEDSNTIGKLFFNLVQTRCFILAKEKVCQQRAQDGTCLKEHIKQKAYLRNNKNY